MAVWREPREVHNRSAEEGAGLTYIIPIASENIMMVERSWSCLGGLQCDAQGTENEGKR